MKRDENYVPYIRRKLGLLEEKKATKADYAEIFEETPIYIFFRDVYHARIVSIISLFRS